MELDLEDAPAFWISPNGEVLPIYRTHIDAVCDNPEAFELTTKKVKAIYNKYKEKLRFEGKARAEIIEGLIKKGWIRIRYLPTDKLYHDDVYHIEINYLSNENKNILALWATGLINTNKKRAFSEVLICELSSDYSSTEGTLEELVNYKLFSNEGVKYMPLKQVISVYELKGAKNG